MFSGFRGPNKERKNPIISSELFTENSKAIFEVIAKHPNDKIAILSALHHWKGMDWSEGYNKPKQESDSHILKLAKLSSTIFSGDQHSEVLQPGSIIYEIADHYRCCAVYGDHHTKKHSFKTISLNIQGGEYSCKDYSLTENKNKKITIEKDQSVDKGKVVNKKLKSVDEDYQLDAYWALNEQIIIENHNLPYNFLLNKLSADFGIEKDQFGEYESGENFKRYRYKDILISFCELDYKSARKNSKAVESFPADFSFHMVIPFFILTKKTNIDEKVESIIEIFNEIFVKNLNKISKIFLDDVMFMTKIQLKQGSIKPLIFKYINNIVKRASKKTANQL